MSGYMVPEVHCDLCDAKEVAEDEGTLRGLREWLRQGCGWVRRRATDDDVPLVAPPTPWKVGDLIDVCLDCVEEAS